jgi:hypothetical protein
VLTEPFDNVTAWTLGTGGTITAGGQVGNYLRMTSGNKRGYPIPAVAQSADVDVEFWWRCSNVTTALVTVLTVRSTATATGSASVELAVTVTSTGAWRVQTTGLNLATGAAGAVVANTWYRLRLYAHLAGAPNGWARLDVGGVNLLNVSGVSTASVTPLAAAIVTDSISGLTEDYDEMRLSTGFGFPAGAAVGDWFLHTPTGDVYEKTGASTWALVANIKGPPGSSIAARTEE